MGAGTDGVRNPRAGAHGPELRLKDPETLGNCPGLPSLPFQSRSWLHVASGSPGRCVVTVPTDSLPGTEDAVLPREHPGRFGGKTPSAVVLGEFCLWPAEFSFQNVFCKRCS